MALHHQDLLFTIWSNAAPFPNTMNEVRITHIPTGLSVIKAHRSRNAAKRHAMAELEELVAEAND